MHYGRSVAAAHRPGGQTVGVITRSGNKRYSKSDVLPQSQAQRNGQISQSGRIWASANRLTRSACLAILLVHAMVAQAAGRALDWSYHPDVLWRSGAGPATAQVRSPLTSSCTPSPVVLPPARWTDSGDSDPRGWHLKQPNVGTGRIEAFTDSRTAVRLAEQQQDSALTSSRAPLPGSEDLPGVLRGLNYRIDFGVEYRF